VAPSREMSDQYMKQSALNGRRIFNGRINYREYQFKVSIAEIGDDVLWNCLKWRNGVLVVDQQNDLVMTLSLLNEPSWLPGNNGSDHGSIKIQPKLGDRAEINEIISLQSPSAPISSDHLPTKSFLAQNQCGRNR
jgi:hypothetical protein